MSTDVASRVALETKAEEVYAGITFSAPHGSPPAWTKKNSEEWDNHVRQTAASSFLVRYRDRVFLMTASHVWSALPPPDVKLRDFMYIAGTWIELPLRDKRKFGTAFDLAALEVTSLLTDQRIGGELKFGMDDLVKDKSLLLIACNRFRFAPFFTGVFDGERKGENASLAIAFSGDGAHPGCSGSPVIDENGFIRGLIVLATMNGNGGFAVPAMTIAAFLDLKFF